MEITELVSREAIHEAKRGNAAFAEWLDTELIAQFQAVVARKTGQKMSEAAIMTDTYCWCMWTSRCFRPSVCPVLHPLAFETHLIDDIYILLSYNPRLQRYPMLEIKTRRC